jgi:hypothetical protein
MLLAAATAGVTLLGYICFLVFCAYVVARTGSTTGLRDVAVAMRAFSLIGSFSHTKQS